jgi:hypothetical protein
MKSYIIEKAQISLKTAADNSGVSAENSGGNSKSTATFWQRSATFRPQTAHPISRE